jgi:hypothetical protein
VNGPFINRTLLDQRYPPGTRIRNDGDVIYDAPNRQTPYAHQATVGYTRELTGTLAISADYIHMANKDMFLARNIFPMLRADTTRTGAIQRFDAFGLLGGDTAYKQHVWVMENWGEALYDALNLSLEKRYANNWSGRVSYSLSSSRGTGNNQSDNNTYQVLTDLNLDKFSGPGSVDRRHILSINGRGEIPKTRGATLAATLRYMSGTPFTIFDSSIDADRNGELNDPLSAGTYSGSAPNAMQNVASNGGRNGAVGPDYFQVDLRAGWRARLTSQKAVEVFLDIFNVTNRNNFLNPSGDRRLPTTYLVLTNLYGGGGFPRQAQMGLRFTF